MKCALAVLLSAFCCATLISAEKKAPPKPVGPLAELPSKPGPLIDKLKNLGDNEWLNIGQPSPDPKWGSGYLRSWGCKMSYASDLGGAFQCGQGPHGMIKEDGRYDDVFFYDLNANRWICVYPGFNTKTFVNDIKSGEIKMGEKGYLVTKDGNAIHAYGHHSYQGHCYDPDTHTFSCGGWATGLPGDQHINGQPWIVEAQNLLKQQLNGKTLPAEWKPYCFDIKTGRITREGPGGAFYLPSRKVYWACWLGEIGRSDGVASPKGPHPPMIWGHDYGGCLDTKRECVYVGRTNRPEDKVVGDFFIYDFAKNEWTNPACKGSIEYMPATCAGMVQYDTANDRVVVFYNGDGKQGIGVWDPSTGAWEPKISVPPTLFGNAMMSGFYSPELNVYIVEVAGDAQTGTFWAYRYKTPKVDPKAKKKKP